MAALVHKARSSWPVRFVEQFVTNWQEHRVGGLAAEISFWGLLSILPLLLVLLSLMGWVAGLTGSGNDEDLQTWLSDRTADLLGTSQEVSDLVGGLFNDTPGDALTLGVIAALYTSSRGFKVVVQALDVVYGRKNRRGFFGSRIIGLLLAAGTAIVGAFVVFLVVVGPLFGGAEDVASSIDAGGWFEDLWTFVRYPLAVLVLTAWIAFLYYVAPNHRAPFKWEIPGAVVSTIVMAVVSIGFRYFLVLLGGTNAIYGTLGVAISLLLWFYLLATGLLVGAEVNAILADWYDIGEQRYQPRPIRTAFWWWWRRREQRAAEAEAEEEAVPEAVSPEEEVTAEIPVTKADATPDNPPEIEPG